MDVVLLKRKKKKKYVWYICKFKIIKNKDKCTIFVWIFQNKFFEYEYRKVQLLVFIPRFLYCTKYLVNSTEKLIRI